MFNQVPLIHKEDANVVTGHNHRLIGAKLDLFHFQDDAAGSVFWHPDGEALYSAIQDHLRPILEANGYQFVRSPQLYRNDMWKLSGHWEHYQDNMYKVGEDMLLKPMNCPAHIQIYKARNVSVHDLPLRYAEFGVCHRNEPSGALNGLMRLRQFVQDDGHIFCAPEQIEEEIADFCKMVAQIYGDFGFHDLKAAISLRPEDRAGSDEDWDKAEAALIDAVKASGIAFELQPGEGAFYGPKLEFSLKDSLGRDWQCGTAQLDFVLPERFGLGYDVPGGQERPVMIHRAVLGSIERFIGILLEEHGARLPYKFRPVQATILPVRDEHLPQARVIAANLQSQGVRARVEHKGSISKRVRQAHGLGRISIVIGDDEVRENAASIRGLGKVPLADLVRILPEAI